MHGGHPPTLLRQILLTVPLYCAFPESILVWNPWKFIGNSEEMDLKYFKKNRV